MVDQWAHGGGHLGNVLGSLYGGYKGIGMARKISEKGDEKTSSFRLNKRADAKTPPPAAPAGGSPPAAASPVTVAGQPAPKASPSTGLLGGIMPSTERGKALAGAGMAGVGLLGAGLVGNRMAQNAMHENLATEEGLLGRTMNRNFLLDQHKMEMDRQGALLHKLKYGY
jgi:hypothetical protein